MRSAFVWPICVYNLKRIYSIFFSYQIVKTYKTIDMVWSKNASKICFKFITAFFNNFLVSIFDIPKDINIYAIYLQITPIYHTYVLPMSKALLARSDWSVFVSLLFFTLLTPSSYAHGALSRAIFPCFLPILPVATFFASLLLVHLLFFDHADRFLLALYTYI